MLQFVFAIKLLTFLEDCLFGGAFSFMQVEGNDHPSFSLGKPHMQQRAKGRCCRLRLETLCSEKATDSVCLLPAKVGTCFLSLDLAYMCLFLENSLLTPVSAHRITAAWTRQAGRGHRLQLISFWWGKMMKRTSIRLEQDRWDHWYVSYCYLI